MKDERRIVLDAHAPVLQLSELRKIVFEDSVRGLPCDVLGHPALPSLGAERCHHVFDVQPLVPAFEHVHPGERVHVLAVAGHAFPRRIPRIGFPQPVVVSGNDEARGQSFDIPLPRGGKRLVEVVDVEDEAALGSREPAEVQQVTIAAGLDANA